MVTFTVAWLHLLHISPPVTPASTVPACPCMHVECELKVQWLCAEGTLVECWRCLDLIICAEKVMIMCWRCMFMFWRQHWWLLQVLVEFDDLEWKKREWFRVHDVFQVFLVEHTLVWTCRPVDKDTRPTPLHFPALVSCWWPWDTLCLCVSVRQSRWKSFPVIKDTHFTLHYISALVALPWHNLFLPGLFCMLSVSVYVKCIRADITLWIGTSSSTLSASLHWCVVAGGLETSSPNLSISVSVSQLVYAEVSLCG